MEISTLKYSELKYIAKFPNYIVQFSKLRHFGIYHSAILKF